MSKILSFNSFIDSQDASKWMKYFLDSELKTANKHEDPDSQIKLVDETRELVDVFFSEVNENSYNSNTDREKYNILRNIILKNEGYDVEFTIKITLPEQQFIVFRKNGIELKY
jgi:hypothetical protein